jgi:hypothetical protein
MTKTQLMTMGPGSVLMRYTVTFTDATAAAKTATVALDTLPIGSLVKSVRMKTNVAFTGGGETAVTCSIGCAAGSATTFSATTDVFHAVGDTQFLAAAAAALAATYAADTLQAFFTSTTNNLSGLTAGTLFIDVEMLLMENLVGTAGGGYLGT